MKVTTAAQMQAIDNFTINKIGIPGVVLMENAGKAVADTVSNYFDEAFRIVILCGKGNNGGDGFVVARHLYNSGFDVRVYIIGEKKNIKGDAKINLDIFEKMSTRIKEITDEKQLKNLKMNLLHSDLIIDAIFGTGLDSAVRGIYGKTIELVNECDVPVLSVDLPSGLCADHGKILGDVIDADCTVTFGLPKRCLYLYPAASKVGMLEVADISFPPDLDLIQKIKVEYFSNIPLDLYLPPRPRDSHKGTFGHTLILGGSPGKTGAPIMAAEAALTCGAGLVTCGIPESLNPILETQLIEAMSLPLPETKEQTLNKVCIKDIKEFIEERKITTIAIGPGISTNAETSKLVIDLVKNIDLPMVIDADALNVLSKEKNLNFLKKVKSPRILTPHPGEMARLIKKDVQYVRENPIEAAEEFAKKHNVILVLKGAPTITADPEGNIFINSTGNPGLACGGSGDVLTGMIAALLKQIENPVDAAVIGVYLHGLAADLASVEKGEISLLASDVINFFPDALNNDPIT